MDHRNIFYGSCLWHVCRRVGRYTWDLVRGDEENYTQVFSLLRVTQEEAHGWPSEHPHLLAFFLPPLDLSKARSWFGAPLLQQPIQFGRGIHKNGDMLVGRRTPTEFTWTWSLDPWNASCLIYSYSRPKLGRDIITQGTVSEEESQMLFISLV